MFGEILDLPVDNDLELNNNICEFYNLSPATAYRKAKIVFYLVVLISS